jgi:hypothetical protein
MINNYLPVRVLKFYQWLDHLPSDFKSPNCDAFEDYMGEICMDIVNKLVRVAPYSELPTNRGGYEPKNRRNKL